MTCPRCNASQTGPDTVGKRVIINSRNPDDETIRRRRECWVCGFRWSTVERVEADGLAELEGAKFLSL